MNRTVVFAIVALAAASAQAQMTKVADTGDRSFYVDAKSTEGTGNVRRVPIVEDYATAQVNGMRSRKMILEVDCGGVQLRALSFDPTTQSHRLTSHPNEAATDAKRVLHQLTEDDREREGRCLADRE